MSFNCTLIIMTSFRRFMKFISVIFNLTYTTCNLSHTKHQKQYKTFLVRYLGDLEGVPSGLLGSISLCSCFCRAILSAACLHDNKQTSVSKAETPPPVKQIINYNHHRKLTR